MLKLAMARAHKSNSAATKWSYWLAGPLMLAYGLVRWHQGLSGARGPGPEWVIGHSLFLISQLMMSFIILDLATETARNRQRGAHFLRGLGWLGWSSKMAGSAQTAIDIVVGISARDIAQMDRMYGRVSNVPGVQPVIYGVGPVIFFLVVVILGIVYAVRARSWQSALAAILLITTLLLGSHLNRLPLTSIVLSLAFWLLWAAYGRDAKVHERSAGRRIGRLSETP